MQNKRTWTTASEFCQSVRDGTHASPKPAVNGRLLITSKHIVGGRIDTSSAYLISESEYVEINRRSKVDRWDVLITMIGTVGEVCLVVDEPDYVIKNIGLFKTDGEFEGRWLFNWLRSVEARNLLRERLAGTTQAYISLGALREFPVPLLPKADMGAVNALLRSIDDKIELNQRMSETLEAMAQAIFRDWFVDFGPVRRKLEGATDSVAIMGGLMPDPARAAELAGLFPDTLGDDDAPQDWVFTTLGEAFDVKIGRTPPRKEAEHFAPRGVGERWMSIRDMGACGAFITATAEGLTKTAVETFRVPPIPDQTVVVSFKLTVGRVAITAGTMFSNEAIAQLRAKAGSPSPWFTYCWMKMFDYDQLGSTSSIATAVNSDSIKGMPFPNVPEGALSRFDEIVEPIFERIRASILESDTLAETRDYLLPRLMSGEVRVGELEAEVA